MTMTCLSQFSELDNILLLELSNKTYPGYSPKVIIKDCPPPAASYSNILSSLAIDAATIESLQVVNILPKMNNMEARHFSDLPKLNELNLIACDLKKLSNKLLTGLGDILYFSARDNSLAELPSDLLKDLRIIELDLSQNRLSSLPEDLFREKTY